MILAGAGAGCILPSTTKAILVWFPVRERATVMGLKQTGVNVGGIIGAATLPALALALSWRYGFVAIGVISIVIGIVSLILYREPPDNVDRNPLQSISSEPKQSVREVFKNREIWLISFAGMCFMVVEFSILAHFVLYLKETLLFTAVAAGLFLAILQAGGALGKPISGFISDHLFHGSRKMVYFFMCCVAVAMSLTFAFLQPDSPLWVIALLSSMLGFVAIGIGGVHLTMVGEIASKELAGTVTGISTAILQIGTVVGPPAFGYIVDTTGSYQVGWQLLAISAAVAAILLLFVREEKRRIY